MGPFWVSFKINKNKTPSKRKPEINFAFNLNRSLHLQIVVDRPRVRGGAVGGSRQECVLNGARLCQLDRVSVAAKTNRPCQPARRKGNNTESCCTMSKTEPVAHIFCPSLQTKPSRKSTTWCLVYAWDKLRSVFLRGGKCHLPHDTITDFSFLC